MREHLYRAKRVDNGELVYGDLVHSKDKCYIKPMGNAFEVNEAHLTKLVVMHPVDPETVCEYTDLTDKNETKIFESAILRWRSNERPYKVSFDECHFKIEDSCGNRIKTAQKSIDFLEVEVIGNYFDNPELLEDKQ